MKSWLGFILDSLLMTLTVVYFEEITVNLDRPKSLFYLIRSNKLFSVYLKSVSCLEQSCLRSILSLDSSQVRHHLPSLHWRCEISYDLFSNSVLKPKSFFSLWLKRDCLVSKVGPQTALAKSGNASPQSTLNN